MNRNIVTIWGRPLDINIIFECYGDQIPTDNQKSRLDSFLSNIEVVDSVLENVKLYCLEDENMMGVSDIPNIFRYVMPDSLYVKRDDEEGIVALLCDYKYDIEHGIAIVFEHDHFREIVSQSDV